MDLTGRAYEEEFSWYNNLSKQARDSIAILVTVVGMHSMVLSIPSISLGIGKI